MRSLFLHRRSSRLSLLLLLALSLMLLSLTRLAVHATAATTSITLSEVTGPPTTALTVQGSGFGSRETVLATFGTTTSVGTTTTSSTGSFSLGIAIPATAQPGKHPIQVTG